jgi:hypothetical protein
MSLNSTALNFCNHEIDFSARHVMLWMRMFQFYCKKVWIEQIYSYARETLTVSRSFFTHLLLYFYIVYHKEIRCKKYSMVWELLRVRDINTSSNILTASSFILKPHFRHVYHLFFNCRWLSIFIFTAIYSFILRSFRGSYKGLSLKLLSHRVDVSSI